MSRPLTPLVVQNRDLLELISAREAPRTIEAFAAELGRDQSNFSKTLRRLAGEGWIAMNPKGSERCTDTTPDGALALQAMAVAVGAVSPGPKALIHADLNPDPDQPRRDFESEEARKYLASLAESIAERGLKQSILVRFDAEGQALVVAGERRWRAIGLLIAAGDPRWPADRAIPHLLEDETDAAEILATQVVENVQRAGLHPLEEAAAFKRLKEDHAWGVGHISKAIGRSRRFVEQRLDLLNLSPGMQDKMRLPKDHDDHLTVPRARELLAHLRQIAAGANEQRDIEEIAPAEFSAEDIEAAKKAKLDARAMLALGEIAAAIAAKPSNRFPHSPVPVVDVDRKGALLSERLGRLNAAKLTTLLIDGEVEERPAGIRVEPLGHLRLRLEKVHPADNPRAVFHLRREAGLSADQARHLTSAGRWSTNFLNIDPPKIEQATQPEEQDLAGDAEIRNRPTIPSIADFRPPPNSDSTEPLVKIALTVGQTWALHELAHKTVNNPVPVGQRHPPILAPAALIADDANQDRDFAILYRNGYISWGAIRDGRMTARLSPLAKLQVEAQEWPACSAEGGYKTAWLNVPLPAAEAGEDEADEARADPEISALSQAEYFSQEVKDAALAAAQKEPGGERIRIAYLTGKTTADGEHWPDELTEEIGTPWHDYPKARIRLIQSDRGRWNVTLSTTQGGPNYSGRGDAYGVGMNDPIFRSRRDALAYAAERIVDQLGDWGKKRKLRDWLAGLLAEPAADAADAAELSIPEIHVLRQVGHAQAANGGEPVVVGRYWLDADAVALWKRPPSGLIEFKAEPLQPWTVSLTEAGRAELDRQGQSEAFALLMQSREDRGEGYACAWLNPSSDGDEDTADQVPAAAPPTDEQDPHADTLATVRAKLAEGAPNFAELLQLAGLPGKITVSEDGVLSSGSTPTDIAVDPWRDGSDQLAQARAELIAWALNFAAGHIEAPAAAGDDLVDQVLRTGSALRDVLALRIDPTTPVWFEVGHAYEPFAKASNALAWRRERAGREEKPDPLLTFNRGDLVTIGGTASGYRLLEPNRPGDNFGGIFPSFLAQQVNLKNGKDYGQPRSISLHAIQGFIKDPDRYLGRTKTEAA